MDLKDLRDPEVRWVSLVQSDSQVSAELTVILVAKDHKDHEVMSVCLEM